MTQRRDGLASVQRTARTLCRLLTTFEPVIKRFYGNNAALLAAWAAAQAACAVLDAVVGEQRGQGV